ncbi:hypothetical protein FORC68_0304 [Listeria monocytogenes]|nr:hypothetical protein FORC68_0304 [Listeria monocytogenes]
MPLWKWKLVLIDFYFIRLNKINFLGEVKMAFLKK